MTGEEGKGCSFEWDEESKLYFHASSGFYHDPEGGWYYSSKDGLYYTFENGNYVLLEPYNKSNNEPEGSHPTSLPSCEPSQVTMEESCNAEGANHNGAEDLPEPPSEWLEETLINLYLMGYTNSEKNGDDIMTDLKTNGGGNMHCMDVCESQIQESASQEFTECHTSVESNQIEDGEGSIPHRTSDMPHPGVDVPAGGPWDEENWQAQYGQVVQSEEAYATNFPVIDLWDWSVVLENGNNRVARLVGNLIRRSIKTHQSLPSSGHLKRTAAISNIHLDLVRVASGKIYRLRTPNCGYLATLPSYDATNPTKGWGFPDLFADMGSFPTSSSEMKACETSINLPSGRLPANICRIPSITIKENQIKYRDRAAQRRVLHGSFGIGPSQKVLDDNCMDEDVGIFSETEAIKMSFGPGSYARRIMEGMGWKEGDALGRRNRGLLEPIQAPASKGNAGVGWKGRRCNGTWQASDP